METECCVCFQRRLLYVNLKACRRLIEISIIVNFRSHVACLHILLYMFVWFHIFKLLHISVSSLILLFTYVRICLLLILLIVFVYFVLVYVMCFIVVVFYNVCVKIQGYLIP